MLLRLGLASYDHIGQEGARAPQCSPKGCVPGAEGAGPGSLHPTRRRASVTSSGALEANDPCCNSLYDLWLAENDLDQGGVKDLARLVGKGGGLKLQKLALDRNPRIQDEGVVCMADALKAGGGTIEVKRDRADFRDEWLDRVKGELERVRGPGLVEIP